MFRISNVPTTSTGTHFIPQYSLETKNFGVAVYYKSTHYWVDVSGVITLDDTDSNSGVLANWNSARNICASLGKRIPSVEILKAINDYGAYGGNLGFVSGYYWSSTNSSFSSDYAYGVNFSEASLRWLDVLGNRYVCCGA